MWEKCPPHLEYGITEGLDEENTSLHLEYDTYEGLGVENASLLFEIRHKGLD